MKNGPRPEHPDSRAILANLSLEIYRPLGLLQNGISSLLSGSQGVLTDAERSQAETLLVLCGEIDQLTQHYLSGTDQRDP